MNKRNIILIGLVFLIVLVGGYYLTKDQGKEVEHSKTPDINKEADAASPEEDDLEEDNTPEEDALTPEEIARELDFTLLNLEGEEVTLSDYQGKIVLINFWATWCVWCDKEMPDIQALHEENDDLVILAVNSMEDEDTVKKYIEEGGYSFPVLFDKDGSIGDKYLVTGWPSSYFVNKDGTPAFRVPGMMTKEMMNNILNDVRELNE